MRTLKPEFWGHPDPPSFEARLLYQAMWNWADDYGIGDANPKALAGFAFPHDDDIDHHRVEQMFTEIAASYDCVFYLVGGRRYYAIQSWKQHQHPKNPGKRVRPGPDLADTFIYQQVSLKLVDPTPESPPGPPPESPPSYVVVRSSDTVVRSSEPDGSERTKRSVSNAREANDANEPCDRMGRKSMSITALAGGVDKPREPPPPDRNVTMQARDLVKAGMPDRMWRSARRIRRDLEFEVDRLLADDADPAVIATAVEALVGQLAVGEDKYPGHLKHIYDRKLAAQTATPQQIRNGQPMPTRDRNFLSTQALKNRNPFDTTRKELT